MQSILSNCSSLLLLGEANFSFSLSLKKLLPQDITMVTSCYQTEDQLPNDDAGIERNIAELRALGARILFGVDATKLDQTPSLEVALYDAIVFTFPHVGGKGNIGRNRELIKQFFECCPRRLSPNGKVLLTLCNGQGGTPADKPQRKWADSWQAVAMATWGSFILTQTLPFCAEDYLDYYCTGYRSQSKRFVTQHAITHVFERSTDHANLSYSSRVPTNLTSNIKQGNHEEMIISDCPPHLCRVMDRNLLAEAHHPLALVSVDLQRLATECFPDMTIIQSEELPLVLSVEDAIISSQHSSSELYHVAPQKTDHVLKEDGFNANSGVPQGNLLCPNLESLIGHPVSPEDVQDDLACTSESKSTYCERVGKEGHNRISEDSINNVATQLDIEVYMESKGGETVSKQSLSRNCEQETKCQPRPNFPQKIMSNFVLRPSLLSQIPGVLKKNNMQSVLACGKVFRRCGIGNRYYPILHQCLIVMPASHQLEESWRDFKDHMSKVAADFMARKGQISISECENNPSGPLSHQSPLIITMEESNELSQSTVTIGDCGIFHSADGDYLFCIWNLDLIAMAKYDVDDIRLFWSTDDRIFLNFAKNVETSKKSRQLSQIVFKGYSLYPPAYTHDVSFWLRKDTFDELEFCSIVRSVTYDLVREVRFLNQYINRKISYTYRLVYQSCDGALTKKTATSLQLGVREAINEWLEVETR